MEKNKKDKKKKKKKESDEEGDKGEKSAHGETTKKSVADDESSLRQRKGDVVKAQNDTKTEKDEQEDTKK